MVLNFPLLPRPSSDIPTRPGLLKTPKLTRNVGNGVNVSIATQIFYRMLHSGSPLSDYSSIVTFLSLDIGDRLVHDFGRLTPKLWCNPSIDILNSV